MNAYGKARRAQGSDGYRYQSQLERDYGEELLLLEKGGAITDLKRQTRVHLATVCYLPPWPSRTHQAYLNGDLKGDSYYYRTDFDFYDPPEPNRIYVDTKGNQRDPRFARNLKLWAQYGPGILRIVKDAGRRGRRRF